MTATTTMFEELRPKAFAVAYRMLGSVGEAEDVVQEAFLRTHQIQREGERIESPHAFISIVVARLCIDQLRSARARRECYVGEWLPEPLVTSTNEDPALHAELADSLSLAFLVLLESLSPEQRAAFLLHDVFGYAYAEVAPIVGKTATNVRQMVVRARKLVLQRKPRFEASRERRDQLAQRFFAAVEHGNLKALEELLALDVMLHGDGGGNTRAIKRPVYGRTRVAPTILAWADGLARAGGCSIHGVYVNGQPGAMVLDPVGRLIGVVALDIASGRVQTVRSIINPVKLRHLTPSLAAGTPAFD